MARFQNNFTEMFLGWPSIKIAKMVWLRWKMVAEAKNRKTFKHHLGQWLDFNIISQKCSLGDPLPKFVKRFCSAEQNGRQR